MKTFYIVCRFQDVDVDGESYEDDDYMFDEILLGNDNKHYTQYESLEMAQSEALSKVERTIGNDAKYVVVKCVPTGIATSPDKKPAKWKSIKGER